MKRCMLWMLALMLLAGCAKPSLRPETADAGAKEAVYTPNEAVELRQSRAAYEGFAMALFAAAAKSGAQNLVLSPASAYFALAMAANGAEGETQAAFDQALGLSIAARNGVCVALAQSLCQAGGKTEISLANSAWVNEGLTIQKGFLDVLEQAYGAEMFQAVLNSTAAQQAMNQWVKEETKGMIPQLFADPLEGDNLVMVLINALCLSAKWQYPLDANTSAREFRLSDGERVEADFMQGETRELRYIEKEGVRGVVLPYDDGRLAFVALLPEEGGNVRALARGLVQTPLGEYLAAGEDKSVFVVLPKFSVEYGTASLKDALIEMGLGLAFDEIRAEFPGMVVETGQTAPVYIGDVLQKVRMDVHELGTEAAAATAVVMRAGGAAQELKFLEFNRPFLYAVMDLETGLPLFMGLMENPA